MYFTRPRFVFLFPLPLAFPLSVTCRIGGRRKTDFWMITLSRSLYKFPNC